MLSADADAMSPVARQACWTLIWLLVAVYTLGAWLVPPAIYSDIAYGFQVWQSMQHGGPWNCLVEPDVNDLRVDRPEFLAMWSPGQYAVPGVLSRLGFNLGHATALTVALATISMLLGWNRLLLRLGFSPTLATLTCLALVCMRHVALPFAMYAGGELLLRSVEPWVVLAALHCRSLRLRDALIVLAAVLGAVFMKLSAMIFAAGLMFYLWLLRLQQRPTRRELLIYTGKLAALFATAAAILYFSYVAHGPTAVTTRTRDPSFAPIRLFYRIGSLATSGVSGGELLDRIFAFPGNRIGDFRDSTAALLALVAASVGLVAVTIRLDLPGRFRTLVLAFAVTFSAITVIDILGSGISFEDRNVRFIGIALLAAMVAIAARAPWRAARLGMTAFLIAMSVYGTSSYVSRCRHALMTGVVGHTGLMYLNADQPLLDLLWTIDARHPGPGTIVFLPTPDLPLEMPHTRVIDRYIDMTSLDDLQRFRFRGRVDNLYVVMPKDFVDTDKGNALLAAFRDYRDWKTADVGGFRIFYEGAPLPP